MIEAPSNLTACLLRRAQQTCYEAACGRKRMVAAQALIDRCSAAVNARISRLPQAPTSLRGTRNVRCTVALAQSTALKSP
jgi:hypothetical protein